MKDLRNVLRVVRSRWRLILGCVLGVVVITGLVTLRATPKYVSEVQLFVSSKSDSVSAYENSLFSTARMASYADLVNSREVTDPVVRKLDLDLTASELSRRITARADAETVLLDIEVTAETPRRAQRLAQAVAEQFGEFVSKVEAPGPAAASPVKATVVRAASLPDTPASPRPLRDLALAGVLGLVVGLGVAFVRESVDTRVKTERDVAEAAGVPVMASVAYDAKARKRPLVDAVGGHDSRAEAYRVLRTNLQYVDVDHSSRVFTVTSPVTGEGKTSTAVNLAVALAAAGQKVLLLEGDLRAPRVHEYLGLEPQVGLTDVLLGNLSLEEAIQRTSVPGLSVLTSGPVQLNPSELLQSRGMADVLLDARSPNYDVVIVDAPPLLPVTDAALLSAQSDGALIVVRHGKTTREQLGRAMDRLRKVGARPVGAVLTMVPGRQARAEGYADAGRYVRTSADHRPRSTVN